MSFRKERKYRLSKFEFEILKNDLFCRGMHTLYNKRKIHSLYYDTIMMDMFKDSEEGVVPRKKLRIRWYGHPNEANIETKISSIEGRFKISTPKRFLSFEDLPKKIIDQNYGTLTPSLLVSYDREYFLLNKMRITFDSLIKYKNYRHLKSVECEDKEHVMEIKVSAYTSNDYVETIIPYATSRFSKYSRGLLISNSEI
tara:strand:- start:475 stop:1068 length:594 start_codon:yes stop_codon:yes gene_type:complete